MLSKTYLCFQWWIFFSKVNPWLIHFNVWQNPLQYCKVINLQLIKKKFLKSESFLFYLKMILYFFLIAESFWNFFSWLVVLE